MIKKEDRLPLALIVLLSLAVFGLLGITVICLPSWSQKEQEKRILEIRERNAKNIVSPTIIGTNELGEVIKRYVIEPENYGGYHYIYEIGNTKTTNIPLPKGRMNVNVEKTN